MFVTRDLAKPHTTDTGLARPSYLWQKRWRDCCHGHCKREPMGSIKTGGHDFTARGRWTCVGLKRNADLNFGFLSDWLSDLGIIIVFAQSNDFGLVVCWLLLLLKHLWNLDLFSESICWLWTCYLLTAVVFSTYTLWNFVDFFFFYVKRVVILYIIAVLVANTCDWSVYYHSCPVLDCLLCCRVHWLLWDLEE